MLKVILLVCATGIQPPDCQEDTALHVLVGPDCDNEISCAMQAQAFLASTEIGRSLKEVGYLKVKITRRASSEVSSM